MSSPPSRWLSLGAAAQALGGVYWMIFERVDGGFGELTELPVGYLIGLFMVGLAVLVAARRRWALWSAVVGNALGVLGGVLTLVVLSSPQAAIASRLPPPPLVCGALALVALPSLLLGRAALGAAR